MELVSSHLEAGIALTQVGNPLPHCRVGFRNRIRSDRLVALSSESVAEPEDEEVAELGFLATDRTEGKGAVVLEAEVRPDPEDLVLGFPVLSCGSLGGELQRKAEVSFELSSTGSQSSRQGLSCGYTWLK